MKYYFFICTLGLMVFFLGCKPDPQEPKNVSFTLTFKAQYDGQHLIRYKDYAYDDYKVQFSRFTSFFSDIRLLKGTEEVLLTDAAWVDFTPDLSTTDSTAIVKLTYTVKEGEYTGIKMGYGVKPSENAKKPQDFPAGHPFNRELEYWAGWKSYIFNKIEGQGDGNNDGQPDIFLIYHCGSDKVYREYAFDKNITVDGSGKATVIFDLKKLFNADNQWLDMRIDDNQFTSNKATDVRVATILMDNFDHATTIE